MGKKAKKSSKKYAASGKLAKEIQARKKHQDIRKKIERKKSVKALKHGGPGKRGAAKVVEEDVDEDEEDGDEEEVVSKKGRPGNGMSVDDLLGAEFMEGEDESMASGEDEDEDEDADEDDNSFASLDDLDPEAHKVELAQLAEKDPEFYKYLEENEKELLEFDVDNADNDAEEGEDEDEEDAMETTPVLTMSIVKSWQKAMLTNYSLKAFKSMLLAFRSGVNINDENGLATWSIESPTVYDRLVSASLRYSPVVLAHHLPVKTYPDGKYKPLNPSEKSTALQRLIQSFILNIMKFLSQNSDNTTTQLALSESSKLAPYFVRSRRAVKAYLKTCLDLWTTASDEVRIAAFIAIRRVSLTSDQEVRDTVLKSTYLALVRASKGTNAYTMSNITLMKNSASELFAMDHHATYQHAFSNIRQLAVHLRNSMKVQSKDAFKQIYNWQYVHCVDFWANILARACDASSDPPQVESKLKTLIFPLVQVAFGAIKLVSNSRSFPFHLCLLRSLVHLARYTRVYIPIVPYILPMIVHALTPSSRPKPSTLAPLDFEVTIRVPTQYVRTKVYSDCLLEEAVFILAEWLASRQVQGSIAFPEIVVPLTVTLKKLLKKSGGGGHVKNLLDKMEEGAKWIEQKRKSVDFGPKAVEEVNKWEKGLKLEESPMDKYVKLQRKVREKRRKLLDKAREGKAEILDEE